MNTKNDGGPAFPGYDEGEGITVIGMSLRDYFAAKAMHAIISKLPLIDMEGEFEIAVDDKVKYNLDIADSAYELADAMLEARTK